MKVAFITRSTLFNIKGGDTIQMLETARHLEMLNISIDIKLAHEKIDYRQYDLLHFFNIIRPADILHHLYKTTQPFVVSPILVDYSEYDRHHRKGVAGVLFRLLSPDAIEYLKTIARWIKGKDKISSISYWWKGQKRCVKEILRKTPLLLPNSHAEYNYIVKAYGIELPYIKVADGIDPVLFSPNPSIAKDPNLVLCVARIEGLKNQLNLIKALNNTPYKLIIIGAAAPNQQNYYRECRKIAAENIMFTNYLPQKELVSYFQKAKVHVLPSWFEVCGLSSLEARSEEHTSELQSLAYLVCRLLLEKNRKRTSSTMEMAPSPTAFCSRFSMAGTLGCRSANWSRPCSISRSAASTPSPACIMLAIDHR